MEWAEGCEWTDALAQVQRQATYTHTHIQTHTHIDTHTHARSAAGPGESRVYLLDEHRPPKCISGDSGAWTGDQKSTHTHADTHTHTHIHAQSSRFTLFCFTLPFFGRHLRSSTPRWLLRAFQTSTQTMGTADRNFSLQRNSCESQQCPSSLGRGPGWCSCVRVCMWLCGCVNVCVSSMVH